MVWINLIVGYNDLKNVAKEYVNIVNAIAKCFETTSPTNIITNDNILNQYSIKHGLKVKKKARLKYEYNCNIFMTTELLSQISLATSLMNNGEITFHT